MSYRKMINTEQVQRKIIYIHKKRRNVLLEIMVPGEKTESRKQKPDVGK
jgi:hypothetical protein